MVNLIKVFDLIEKDHVNGYLYLKNHSYLWDCLLHNKVFGVMDGSHIPNTMQGSGSFALAERYDIQHAVKGGSKCYMTHGMSSQTAEHYGVIGMFVMIIVLGENMGNQQEM